MLKRTSGTLNTITIDQNSPNTLQTISMAIGKMEDIMEVVHVTKKGKTIATLEGFHIYKETKAGNQINDRLTVRENAIFETIVQEEPCRGRAAPQQPTARNNSVVGSHSPPAGRESYTRTEALTPMREEAGNSLTEKKL